MPFPKNITDHRASGVLEIEWDDGVTSRLAHALLRARCRCAACEQRRRRGDGESKAAEVRLVDLHAVADKGLNLFFSDGHGRGIYPWPYLREIGAVSAKDSEAPLVGRAPDASATHGQPAGGRPRRRLVGTQGPIPGFVLCVVIALAATFVAELHGGPQLLYALLLGMALAPFGEEPRAAAGIDFCTRFVLRLGVALLGARITAAQIVSLGWPTALLVGAAVASTIAGGIWLARRLGMSGQQGLLSGGATAICGASAALAIAAALPRTRELDHFTLLVVVCVSTLSTLAMLLYPLLAQLLDMPPAWAGLFLGATIHDVAQVVGAGYVLGPEVGDTAVIVKLFRVALLAVVVVAISGTLSAQRTAPTAGARRAPWLPWFLLVYLVLVVLNSLHALPTDAQPILAATSRACLVLAIAALGLKTELRSLALAGWRPLLLLACETLWLAFAVLGGLYLMRPQ